MQKVGGAARPASSEELVKQVWKNLPTLAKSAKTSEEYTFLQVQKNLPSKIGIFFASSGELVQQVRKNLLSTFGRTFVTVFGGRVGRARQDRAGWAGRGLGLGRRARTGEVLRGGGCATEPHSALLHSAGTKIGFNLKIQPQAGEEAILYILIMLLVRNSEKSSNVFREKSDEFLWELVDYCQGIYILPLDHCCLEWVLCFHEEFI